MMKLSPTQATCLSLDQKLQYFTLTRPDIRFPLVRYNVYQKMQAPLVFDFNNSRWILSYVKGPITMGVSFTKATDYTVRTY